MSSAPLAVVFLDGAYEDAAYYRSWAAAAGLVVAADGGARFLLDIGGAPQGRMSQHGGALLSQLDQ